jgi:hypothetical protein
VDQLLLEILTGGWVRPLIGSLRVRGNGTHKRCVRGRRLP